MPEPGPPPAVEPAHGRVPRAHPAHRSHRSHRAPAPAVPTASAAPTVPAASAVPEAPLRPALERILRGPSGLGTAGLSGPARGAPASEGPAVSADPAEGRPIPGLYFHPVPEPDPARVAEVSRRVKEWAVDEVDLFPDDWEGEFDGFLVGRYMVACHPDAPTVDHLMVATRLMVAENAVDDCYCEDHGGSPSASAAASSSPTPPSTRCTPRRPTRHSGRTRSTRTPPARVPLRDGVLRPAGHPSQADRYRHDMARLHLGYLAEAAWAETDHLPEVWEYLAMRQFNNFRPCPTITDTVGGYELPADLHARPDMQRVLALAGNASTIVNDLYSYTKELDSPGRHLNLPVVLAERESLSEKDAYLKAVEVHNDLMRDFEAEAAALAAACPVPSVLRFLRGVAVWVDGNHHWHRTNTYRYSLPDFW